MKVEIDWMQRWDNDPRVIITPEKWTDGHSDDPRDLEFRYRKFDNGMMIAETEPWVKFVYVDDPNGDPRCHGALGGDYTLLDGTVFHTRTGWSSRAGVINRDYREYIQDGIVDVTLRYGPYTALAGYAIHSRTLAGYMPKGVYLNRVIKFKDEPYWIPSVDPHVIKKPEV